MSQARILFTWIFSIAVLCAIGARANAGTDTRVALVIGNSAYEHTTALPNPVNDAAAVAETLRRMKFDVTLATNLRKRDLDTTLANFSEKASKSDLALVFYAGHGMEMDGVNYLIPVDATLTTDSRVRFETVSLGDILDSVSGARKLRIVLLDACRNNPFRDGMVARGLKRALGRGLADVKAQPNEFISYSASVGQVAADGDGQHSPYTTALLANIEKPGVEVNKLFRIIAANVRETTGGQQVPYESQRLPEQDVFFVDPPTAVQDPGALEQTVLAEWQAVKETTNRGVVEAFLARHSSDALFSALAREKLQELTKSEVASLPPPPVASNTALAAPEPMVDKPIAVSALDVQTELKRLGCYAGKVDGRWGRSSNASIASFNKYAKADLSGDQLDQSLLKALKIRQGTVCPSSCEPGMTLRNGDCVKIVCDAGSELKNGTCVRKRVAQIREPARKPSSTSNCITFGGDKFCE